MNTLPASSPRKARRLGITGFAVIGMLFATAAAEPTSDELTVKARDALPPDFFRSVHYEIAEDVTQSRFYYHFNVTSDFGRYAIASLPMLRVRLHEILTLAEVAPTSNKSSASLDRSPPGRRGVGGDSVAGILADPLGTAETLLGNLAYNLEETLAEPEREKPATGPAVDNGFSLEPGPHKRSAGKMRGPIAPTRVLPVGPVAFGSGVLDERLRSILKNKSAAEIHADIDERLAAAGVSAAERAVFLANRSYTPRTRLYFTRYLGLLKQATGVGQLVQSANSASTETDARAFVNLARMIAYYELTGSHIMRIIEHRKFPVMLTDAGALVFALPIDHFSWNDGNAALIASLDRFVTTAGATSTTLLVAGSVTDTAKTQLATSDIQLREHYSF